MADRLVNQILTKAAMVHGMYHRLVLVVAPSGAGKTVALHAVHNCSGAPLINVNLELTRRMLELTERQRALQLPRLFQEIISSSDQDMVLLDNIEIIFDIHLQQDPLRLLQSQSRNKTLVASWNGAITKDCLTYATADHPEYRRYPLHDLIFACPEGTI